MFAVSGFHSEIEIPQKLDHLRPKHPDQELCDAWPFDLPTRERSKSGASSRLSLTKVSEKMYLLPFSSVECRTLKQLNVGG